MRWLVRTWQNEIYGPVDQAQLIEEIRAGKWTLRDEACRENHYWFSFSEPDELSKQLGITWPSQFSSLIGQDEETDEITATETKILAADADTLEILQQHGRLAAAPRPALEPSSAEFKTSEVDEDFAEKVFWKHPVFWIASALAIAFALWLSSQ
jgi:hypothetical protein